MGVIVSPLFQTIIVEVCHGETPQILHILLPVGL